MLKLNLPLDKDSVKKLRAGDSVLPRPASSRVGAYASILAEVVGPQLPLAKLGFAGQGPA